MIMDRLCEFCDATALNTGAAGSYVLGSSYDMTIPRDIGAGQGLWLVITVDTAATSGGSATAEFQLRSDAQDPIHATTSTLHFSSGAIAVADLTQGKKYYFPVPSEGTAYERFLGLVQVTAVAAFTAGKINAFITTDPPAWQTYPEGSN